jgi:hypothetical protein
VAIIPARPYRARDKAKAEVGVQVVQRWIVAALRKRKFFSLAEVNQAIAELLVRLNQRPFRKREGSRATLFAQLDQPALKHIPPHCRRMAMAPRPPGSLSMLTALACGRVAIIKENIGAGVLLFRIVSMSFSL